ncbi:MerR family transcriptional regulator [Kribbella sp. CA-293567]|uniref:MerR family transcriptional regulator n=1 Tax=Kribbella sp. CA-293567 TaxID=3002436 RepID=UPI0022DE7E1E|nr:MerR family transcriptional regulator [Kribbella sp. CA-293567]WBQ07596.1 MerR family transcriptional regulator [Kribbella sp. CA-293567]
MMNIGEFARLGGVTTRMLRHYDALGLLVPDHVDPHTSRRSYAVAQLTVLNRLLALKGLGFRLDELGPLLHDGIISAELTGMLRLREAELERQVRHNRHTLDRVQARLRLIEQEPRMNVDTKHLEPVTLAALSADALDASREQTGSVVQTLFEQVILQMEAAGADRTTPIAHYQPHPAAEPASHPELAPYSAPAPDHEADHDGNTLIRTGAMADSDADEPAIQITAGYALTGPQVPGLHTRILPATDVATVIHHGPMNTISTAYQQLARWAESTGRQTAPFTWREHYLEAPGEDQSHWIVEVQLELP